MTDYEKLMNTCSHCGLKIITDDFCCKLLAWVYMFGAETEMVTYNVALRTDIQEAQRRLNVFGGEVPNNVLCNKMREYLKECGEYFKPVRPIWVNEIDNRYGITTKGEDNGEAKRLGQGNKGKTERTGIIQKQFFLPIPDKSDLFGKL